MADQSVFQRVEKKYLIHPHQYKPFMQELEKHMVLDQFGLHTICNIYYDTDSYYFIRNSIEKPAYKEKLRLRSYGIPKDTDTVFVELKKKYKGIVYKRRVAMTLREAEYYLDYGIKLKMDNQIFREIDYFLTRNHPKSKLYLAYDRRAYYGKEDNSLRLTLDQNIRSREEDLHLGSGDAGVPCLAPGEYLMELKVMGAMPLWLVRLLTDLEIYPVSFSKYGTIYKQNLNELWRNQTCLTAY